MARSQRNTPPIAAQSHQSPAMQPTAGLKPFRFPTKHPRINPSHSAECARSPRFARAYEATDQLSEFTSKPSFAESGLLAITQGHVRKGELQRK